MLELLIDHPSIALLPAFLFAVAAFWLHSRTAWVAAGLWLVYVVYELAIQARCGADCYDRLDLLVVYPLLAVVTLTAVVQLYVHRRARRLRRELRRQRRRTLNPDPRS